MGIALAILSSVILAAGNVCLKKGYKDFTPAVSFFFFSVFCMLIWAPAGLLMHFTLDQIWLGIAAGVISAIFGQLSYIYTLSKGELSITGTILSTYAVYTIVFSFIFNHERMNLYSVLFIALTILGTIIVSLPDKVHKNELRRYSNILLATACAISIAASDTFSKYVINSSSLGNFLVWVSVSQFVISFLFLKEMGEPISQFKEILTKMKEYKWPLLGALGASLATMGLFLAFKYTLASIASPINSTYPVLTILLSLVFLKEKISVKNWVGLILVIVSVVGVSFVSS